MDKYQILKKYFGYDSLREGQEELIDSALQGRDVLGIMPTGAGKSLCYQIPALMFSGITLVISPLISLMIDQVKALNQAGIHAAYINSSLTETQIAKALENARRGQYKIIYVAPERLETTGFLDFAMAADISMVTVDEAHCISQWGQDFRPSYVKIVQFIKLLPKRPVISAFTATATKAVKEDILCILNLRNPKVLVTGFDRKNLFFKVVQMRGGKQKDEAILDYINQHKNDSGIIYCATRKNVEAVCEMLQSVGIKAGKYHAGLGNEERKQNQDDFIYDVNPVMVATNAFGMGIDKSNVRYVLHYNMPQSLENYYQEAGRAGRDGEPAECVLFYSPQDVMINRFLLENKNSATSLSSEDLALLQENDEIRLQKMTYYCTATDCLRQYILNYFGEQTIDRCENCGNCLAEYESKDVTDICKDIIRCILDLNQRYGINVVVDTMLGRNKAKVRSLGLDSLKTFGIRKGESEKLLKSIIDKLQMERYLLTTQDKYMIIKLSSTCREILDGEHQIFLKVNKEAAKQEEKAQKTNKKRKSDILTSRGLELFDTLRELRSQIAREESMPPYIICSDKTLTDMCIKMPFDKEEMLNVSGIGENKYEKYGECFIEAIKQFSMGKKEVLYYEDATETEVAGNRTKTTAKAGRKEEFCLTPDIEEKIVFCEKTTISDFVKQLNDLRDETRMKRIAIKYISDKLIEEGYMKEVFEEGMWRKVVTEKGKDAGIFTEIRISKAETEYSVIMYNQQAQELLVQKLKKWLQG